MEFISKVVLLACSCDLPAKCLMLNTIQFNGMYGCSKCYQPGITAKTNQQGPMHIHLMFYNQLVQSEVLKSMKQMPGKHLMKTQ